MIQTFSMRIMSPVALAWEAEVVSLTAANSEGPFDILPDHARFLSLVHNAPIAVELPDGTQQSFTFENAMLFFEDNELVLYIQEDLKTAT